MNNEYIVTLRLPFPEPIDLNAIPETGEAHGDLLTAVEDRFVNPVCLAIARPTYNFGCDDDAAEITWYTFTEREAHVMARCARAAAEELGFSVGACTIQETP